MSIKSIVVIAQKGGVGKGFLSDEIAFYFDRKGIPYNFYDLDQQGGDIHEDTKRDNAVVSIADTPGALQDYTDDLIAKADVIIVPTRTTTRDMPPLETVLAKIEAARKVDNTVIVLNCFNQYKAAAAFKEWFTAQHSNFSKVFTVAQSEIVVQAAMSDRSVVDVKGNSTVAENIKTLTKAIGKMIERG